MVSIPQGSDRFTSRYASLYPILIQLLLDLPCAQIHTSDEADMMHSFSRSTPKAAR